MDIQQKPAWGMDSFTDPRDQEMVMALRDKAKRDDLKKQAVAKNLERAYDPNSTEPMQTAGDGLLDRWMGVKPKTAISDMTQKAIQLRVLAQQVVNTDKEAAAAYRAMAKAMTDKVKMLQKAEAEQTQALGDTGGQMSAQGVQAVAPRGEQ